MKISQTGRSSDSAFELTLQTAEQALSQSEGAPFALRQITGHRVTTTPVLGPPCDTTAIQDKARLVRLPSCLRSRRQALPLPAAGDQAVVESVMQAARTPLPKLHAFR